MRKAIKAVYRKVTLVQMNSEYNSHTDTVGVDVDHETVR